MVYGVGFGVITFLGFWIAYGVVAGYTTEFKASGNLFTYNEYVSYVNGVPAALPGVYFRASAPSRNGWSCSWSAPSFLGIYAVDNTTMPTIEPGEAQVWRIRATVEVQWVPESADRIVETQQVLREWLRDRDHYLYWDTWPEDYVDGFKDELIVSDNDARPTQFNKARGIAAAFFWAGIVHCFEIDAIPAIPAVAVKTSAVMRELPSGTDLGSPSCHRTRR
jgi:hypothetical protein